MKTRRVVTVGVVVGAVIFGYLAYQNLAASLKEPPAPRHFIAGFNITTAPEARQAASLGVNVAINYAAPASAATALGAAFQAAGMRQVDATISDDLYQYECHRLFAARRASTLCAQDFPQMDEAALLARVTQAVTADHTNPTVMGYWILDDWPPEDPGSGRAILQRIAGIIHSKDPGRVTLCGFGANVTPDHGDDFAPALMGNFSAAACDVVGLYIYSASVIDPATAPTAFDWSLAALMPKMAQALAAQGWSRARQPLLGIAQAWGGTRLSTPSHTQTQTEYEIPPTEQDVAQESASFCQQGAAAVGFYAWDEPAVSDPQTLATSAALRAGMAEGINACQQSWGGAA